MSKTHYLSLFPNSAGDVLPGIENIGRLFYKLNTDAGLHVCTPTGWQKITDTSISVSWDNITGKPSTYTVGTHTHEIADINNLATILAQKANTTDISISWDNITNKPVSFPVTTIEWTSITGRPSLAPSIHTHEITDINGLTVALASKVSSADISGKEDKSNKGAANGYAPLNIDKLVPALNLGTGTANSATYLRGDGTWGAISAGSLTGFSVTPLNGIITTVTNATSAPNLEIGLGDITPLSVNTPSLLHATGITLSVGGRSLVSFNNTEASFFGGIREGTTTSVSSGSAYTVNIANGTLINITLTANCVYTFPSPATSKGLQFTILQLQGATPRTVTWPASVRWAGGSAPTITAVANKTDVLSFVCDGTYWLGFVSGLNYTRS